MPLAPLPLAAPLQLMLFSSSLLLSMCSVSALKISSLNDFIDFTNNVNNGINNYTGETVLLTDDLDMSSYSSSFVPVGNSTETPFLGAFDGQGYVISNLVASSDKFRFLSIFGYSKGTTIKNLVVDKSCSFENNHSINDVTNNSATGGILGWCNSNFGRCVVEGCVNMAQITYSGLNWYCSYLGGIVGKFTPINYDTSIANCVNYGNISSTSSISFQTRIGGITGEVWTGNSISFTNTIKNCVNFGALYQSGEIKGNMYIGGISAVDRSNIVYENCVSLGNISYNESISMNRIGVGSISGYSNCTIIANCFWGGEIELNATGSLSVNTTTQEGTTSLDLSQFTNGQVILETLMESTNIPFSIINLDTRGGCAVGPVILFLSAATGGGGVEVTLPSPVRVESTFRGWYSDEDLTAEFDASGLSAGNTTVYAKWDVNKYIIAFIVDGGVYNESSQEYGAAIAYPPTAPTRDGFTFDGWYNDSAFTNKANTDLTVRGNLTLYGRFISTTIRIEFNTKDLSSEDMVKEIERVAGCTDCFIIIEVEDDKGTPTIIVKFNELSGAVDFMRTLDEYIQDSQSMSISSAQMVSNESYINDAGSFSPLTTFPIISTVLLFYM